MTAPLPRDVGLWSGFLDRLPAHEAVAAARTIEAAGIPTVPSSPGLSLAEHRHSPNPTVPSSPGLSLAQHRHSPNPTVPSPGLSLAEHRHSPNPTVPSPGLSLAEHRRSPNPTVPSSPGLSLAEHRRSPNPTIWLQEFSGVDPFVRAALYLQGTSKLTVALGVATIHARDPEAMVAAAATLHEAFPGRFLLGLGTSHRQLAEARGGRYDRPLSAMRDYLGAMDAAAGRRVLPPRFLGALGPRMAELAGAATDGLHTYFCPVAHTAATRAAVGPATWIAPTQLVALSGTWPDAAREYLGFCLAMPNYRNNLHRYGFTDAELNTADDRLLDALVVPDEPEALAARVAAHHAAGADHVVLQFIPPPRAQVVLDRITTGPLAP